MSFYVVWLLTALASVVLGAAPMARARGAGAAASSPDAHLAAALASSDVRADAAASSPDAHPGAAVASSGRGGVAAFVWPALGAVAGALVVLFGWTASPIALAGFVIALAVLELTQHRFASIARVGAALLAMQVCGHLALSGVPTFVALPIGAALALLPTWLQRRSASFAPARMHEEALLIVLVLGVVLAAAPEIESGWRSATALNANAVGGGEAAPIPMWALGALGAALLIGCVSRMLRRS
jgi:hypothetical protein